MSGGRRVDRLKRLWRTTHPTARRLLVAGGVITGVFLVMAVLAPVVAPYGEAEYRDLPQLGRPGADHWFGTTNLRYDVFSRVVFGTRLAFQVVILSTALAMVLGVPLGLIAGYTGRRLDRVLVLLMDAMYAFPSLLLAIVAAFALARFVGQGVPAAAVSISVIYIPQYFRVVRNHTLAVREETFVEAARAMGAHRRTIVGRYVLFNVVQSVPVIFTVNAADAILTLAALGFLGYGVPIPAAEWGYDISRAIGDVANGFWWTSLFPGLFILALVTGLTLLGRGDQRHRQPPAAAPGGGGGRGGAGGDGRGGDRRRRRTAGDRNGGGPRPHGHRLRAVDGHRHRTAPRCPGDRSRPTRRDRACRVGDVGPGPPGDVRLGPRRDSGGGRGEPRSQAG